MVKPKSKPNNGSKKHKTGANKDVPPKANKSSSSHKHDEPGTSSSEATQPTTFIVPKENTLIVGNLSENVNEFELYNHFEKAGEILKIHLPLFEDMTCKGSAQIVFAKPEAVLKACQLNGSDLMGQAITLNFGHQRTKVSHDSSSLKKPDDFSANTVLIKGFDAAYDAVKIQRMVEEHFYTCGPDIRTSIMMDDETGASKGYLFLEFRDHLSVSNALQKNGSMVGGFCLQVEKAP